MVATGWTVPDLWVRRLGSVIAYNCNSATVAAGEFSVGPSGNIANQALITGVPPQFRVPTGRSLPLGALGTGPVASFYTNDTGSIILSAMLPGDGGLNAETGFSFGGVLLG